MPHAENGVILPCTHHFDQPIKSTNRVSYRRQKTLFSALEKPMDNPAIKNGHFNFYIWDRRRR
jgi:hypothetical protein